ncbi:MAG: ATP-binding protein [Bacteroidales bacterium]|nr:ATP-binding protein [Bacteroidales bacterium]MCM1414910.1 ATP-binding protein [bacterium]MCM1423059.1 ATP-binding protein [bacterium]
MDQREQNYLQFRVSTALKSIIGKDLINDKYIAVFELVKNAYDAGASLVEITFENMNTPTSRLIIKDDGKGMNLADIRDKWLFIAYSEKKKESRKEARNQDVGINDYRDLIKRKMAGAKGVGRFSCDRLGAKVKLKSKTESDEAINFLNIDWSEFEVDDEREIKEIEVQYSSLPAEKFAHGTILEICELREQWKRADFLALKRALMKLINPENDLADDCFEIYLNVESELSEDFGKERDNEKVNGKITNDIIEKLGLKTTNLEVQISEDGETVTTELWDRGEFIFKFQEKNEKYTRLKNIKFKLLYLNRSAKYNFSLVMGMTPVNYGSVMVYKNGFRIYPYGEPGEDLFYIDRRKSQGRNRYLGTRDIIGRILILGENNDFVETTSRDGGFVFNETVSMFYDFFTRRVLRTLEKYVVDVINWGDPEKEEFGRGVEQGLMPRDVAGKILEQFAGYSNLKRHDLISFEYNENLIEKMNEKKADGVEASVQKIINIANKTENNVLLELAGRVKRDTSKLLQQKQEADVELENVQSKLDVAHKEISIRKEQNFFLEQAVNKNEKYLLNGMHLNFTYSEGARGSLIDLMDTLNEKGIDDELIQQFISEIMVNIQKINKTSEYAIKGNFNLKSTETENDIRDFISQYIGMSKYKGIKISLDSDLNEKYMCVFDVSSIGIILDNIVSNARKAAANTLLVQFIKETDNIIIKFIDNGKGLDPMIKDLDTLFELGVTTTKEQGGNGIGLNHIKLLVEDMNGLVSINEHCKTGFELIVRIKR